MFASAELPHEVDKATFKADVEKLREDLLEAQIDLAERGDFAALVVLGGLDGAGRSAVLGRFNEWLDPRHVHTQAFDRPSEEERARPRQWRYWLTLPAKGRIGIYLGSWYRDALERRLIGGGDDDEWHRDIESINRFETMLAAEGVLLIKMWLYIAEEDRKRRLAAIKRTPGGRRHILEFKAVLRQLRGQTHFAEALVKEGVRRTSSGHAPWVVVPSANERYRDLMAGRTLLNALKQRLTAKARPVKEAPVPVAPAVIAALNRRTVSDDLDLNRKLDRETYKNALSREQTRLAKLTDSKAFRRRALVVAFEGNDAAGKGGTIRRVTQALDPRRFRVHSIAAPSDEEKAQPYLWRFWRRIPRLGDVAIFDRTWYGRVLVERVEGFCHEADWLRAYAEINDFEEQLVAHGIVLAKFWLAISKDEQLRRFEEREKVPYKRYKITPEDWRNREKWDAYAEAVADMVDRTSREEAPWTLVASQDKLSGRITVLKTLNERLAAAL
jgi:polyphosphate:AMP phosphotransferase